MNFLMDILSLMLKTMLYSLINPYFWLVILIVIMQYRRTVNLEKKLFGDAVNNIWQVTSSSLLFGILGGFFGSILLLLLGISLDSVGIVYLWPVAIFLFLFNPRFLCFAYAGGIVAVFSLFLRALLPIFPMLAENKILAGVMEIHLPSLLALIGILHLTESLLIYLSGHGGASPIYLKTPDGDVIGGYSLQRFWPLPLIGLWAMAVAENSQMFVGGISMPDWWPLLGTVMNLGASEKVIYLMFPIVAGLGYGDLALSSDPASRRIKTAKNLAVYSILLSVAAVVSAHISMVTLFAAFLAPLGHEYLIHKGNREERSRPPIFSQGATSGLRVLAVLPNTPAEKAGIKSGDNLMEVNVLEINSEQDFWHAINLGSPPLIKIKQENRIKRLSLRANSWARQRFGAIFVPGKDARIYVEINKSSFWERFRKKRK